MLSLARAAAVAGDVVGVDPSTLRTHAPAFRNVVDDLAIIIADFFISNRDGHTVDVLPYLLIYIQPLQLVQPRGEQGGGQRFGP